MRKSKRAPDAYATVREQEYELVGIGALKPFEGNPRRGDVQAIVESVNHNGFYGAIVAQRSSNRIIAGNHRWKAAKEAGIQTVPVIWLDVDDDQAKRILLADNRTNDLASYDDQSLADLLSELSNASDLIGTGYDEKDLEALIGGLVGHSEIVEDEVPEPPADPITKPGDLWLLGEHRLLCGDSTNAADVSRLIGDGNPFLCVTDPPYGVNYKPEWRSEAAKAGHLAYAARRVGHVENDDRADWSAAWALTPCDVIYSWHPAGAPSLVHAKALQDSGFVLRMQIIWAKSNFPIGRGDYHVRHEPCWYAVRKGKAAKRTDDRTQTTLWEINLDRNVEGGHSTQKPVECMARPMRNHDPCDVYDPFLGSGTTLIAAEQLGRKCYGMEISPAYCDVVVKRWENLTGETAVVESHG